MKITRNELYIKWVISLISLYGVQKILLPGATVRVAIQLLIVFFVAYLFYAIKNNLKAINFEAKNIVIAYIWCGLFVFAHSAYISDTYEQWRFLVSVYAPTILFGVFCIFGAKLENFILSIKMLTGITLLLSLIFLINGQGDKNANADYTRYISFSSVIILFFPLIKNKTKFISIGLTIIGVYFDLSNRSNILSVFANVAITCMYFLLLKLEDAGIFISKKIASIASVILIITPIVLVVLGAIGSFNIFEAIEENSDINIIDAGDGRKNNIDSRTVIYRDALTSIEKNNSWVFGNGATYFYETGLAESLDDYDGGRLAASESFFVGHLMFGGLIYVLSFFSIVISVVYYGIYKSNSVLAKMLAVSASFKWFFAFIESPLDFNIYWIVTFMVFGVVLGGEFRSLRDDQIKYLFNKIGDF